MPSTITADRLVPILAVADIHQTVSFYVDGVGFEKTGEWIENGRLRWCMLEYPGGAAIMAQEYGSDEEPPEDRNTGIKMYVWCSDARAFHREAIARGIAAGKPFVGNGMHVVEMKDPDGYEIAFQSPTDEPESH